MKNSVKIELNCGLFFGIKCWLSTFYALWAGLLVDNNPYLGVILSKDLKWSTHIDQICKKSSSTLGFVQRNLKKCPAECRKTAYTTLVRSTLEYGAVVWDPYLEKDIVKIEKIQ